MEEIQEKLVACIDCANSSCEFDDNDPKCYVCRTSYFDPVYGWLYGHEKCRDINKNGHCDKFNPNKYIFEPVYQDKRWWQFWK